MFGDKLTTANAKISSLVALIVATGFKLDAASVTDPKTEADALPTADAFKAHLATSAKAATDAAVSAAVAPLNTQLATLAGVSAEATALKTGLADAGVKLGDFVTADKAEGKTPEEKAKAAATANAALVKTAIETSVASKSAKQIAASGHPSALDIAPGGGDAPKATDVPATKADFHATLTSLSGVERTTYFRKHKAKFGL